MNKIGILLLSGVTGLAGIFGLLFYSWFPQATFTATIISVDADLIEVEVAIAKPGIFFEGEPLLVSLKDFTRIVDSSGSRIDASELEVGDRVEILFDGSIAESYPGRIFRCFRIRIVG